MNKKELIEAVAGDTFLTKKEATAAVDSIISNIEKELSAGGEVKLVGFGTFKVVSVSERTMKSPFNGAEVTIPSKLKPTFRPSQELKKTVNGE